MSNEPDVTPQTPPTNPTPNEPSSQTPPPPDSNTPPAPAPAPEPPAFDVAEVTLDTIKAKLPEGAELNEELANDFLAKLNGAKSRTELAETLTEMQVNIVQQAQEAMAQAWEDTQTGWKTEMEKDAEVGGERLAENLAKAQEVINTYAKDPAGVKELFALTGAGNNIHMLKMLLAISAAIPGESAPVQGNPTPDVRPREARLFNQT